MRLQLALLAVLDGQELDMRAADIDHQKVFHRPSSDRKRARAAVNSRV